MDTPALRTGLADKIQKPGITTVDYASWPQPLSNCAAHTLCSDGSSACLPQQTELPARGLLPAIASELAGQIQARKRASLNCQLQPTCSSEAGQVSNEAADVPGGSAHGLLKQNSKRALFSSVTCTDITLAQQAASLEDEFGTAVIADKAAWVAVARQTAPQDGTGVQTYLSVTSALLQAIAVAAAVEPGNSLLPLPPSWKRQHRDACLPSLHTTALQHQAGITTAAVAAPASLLALASDAHSHLPEQTAGDPDIRLGANVATSSSFKVKHSQAPIPVFQPVVHRLSQQDLAMASPLPEQASKGAQVASRADAEGAVHSKRLRWLGHTFRVPDK